jgi:hypothetical protein
VGGINHGTPHRTGVATVPYCSCTALCHSACWPWSCRVSRVLWPPVMWGSLLHQPSTSGTRVVGQADRLEILPDD